MLALLAQGYPQGIPRQDSWTALASWVSRRAVGMAPEPAMPRLEARAVEAGVTDEEAARADATV